MFKSMIKPLLLAVCVVLLASTTATAREYVVHTCKLPDGRPAPTDGWSTHGSAPYMWFQDACASGGALTAGISGVGLPANHPAVGWGFNSGDAAIRGYRIVRSGVPRGYSGAASMLLYSSDAEDSTSTAHQLDYCAAYRGCGGISGMLVRATPAIPSDSHRWFISLVCGGNAGGNCPLAAGAADFGNLRVDSASFTLDDGEQPTVGAVEGTLTTDAAGGGGLRIAAEDSVSGLRRATLELDGNVVATASPDHAGSTCAEVGQSPLPDFTLRRPCPVRALFELNLAQSQLPAGEHVLRARVYDAAGNGVTAFGPRTVVIGGGGSVGSLSTSGIIPDQSSSLLAAFGRTLNLTGTLVGTSGLPLAGAKIVATQLSPAAFTSRRTVTLTTDGAGRYALRLRATSNRTIELAHAESGATLKMRLAARAKVRLRARRSKLPPLGRMRLTGRLQTERARRGTSVAIKVRRGRSWRTIGVTRADTRGRFKFNYRFRRTRHASFIFRAVVLRSGDVVVSPRPSNRVRVRVG